MGWTRGDYYAASGQRIALVRSIMADWIRLKELRKSQGFNSTTCQLLDAKNKNKKSDTKISGGQQERLDWHEEIDRQMDEARRLFDEHVRLDQYKRQKAQCRRNKRSRKKRKVIFKCRIY